MDGGIVNDISLRRHLNHNAHLDGAVSDSIHDVVKKKVRTLICCSGWVEVLVAILRNDAIAPEFADSSAVREFVGAHGVKGFLCEARGDGLGRLNEGQRSGMRGKKRFHRRGLRCAGAAGMDGAEDMILEIKSNGDAARAGTL